MLGLKYLFKKNPEIPTNKFNFKVQYPFDKRKSEALRILSKHSGKVPIILEKADNTDAPEIDKQKWLVEETLTIGQFLLTIRRRIKIDATETIFLFVNNIYIPSNNETLGQIYSKYKDIDSFLYMTYAKEMSYGR